MKRSFRSVDGVLLLDKPREITSACAVGVVKRKFGIQKVGHAGTLDPMATGLLMLVCGSATKLQYLLQEGVKVYEGLIQLGIATDTDDVTGRIIQEDNGYSPPLEHELGRVESEIERHFTGPQLQRPPSYSACKVKGRRGYELARLGASVEFSPRRVVVESLQVKFIGQRQLSYRVSCSKGTYVRGLARDIGRYLETYACLETIRRIRCGGFVVDNACHLDELGTSRSLEEVIIPIKETLPQILRINLDQPSSDKFRHGLQDVLAGLGLPAEERRAFVLDQDGTMLGLIERGSGAEWRIKFGINSA